MRLLFTLAALLASLAVLVPSSYASSPKRTAPPGNSGVDEYVEVVPGGGGNRPLSGLRPRAGGKAAPGISAQAQRKLRAYGSDGRRAARIAALTSDRGRSRGKAPGAALRSAKALSASDDGGVLAALERVAANLGGSGLGALFPILLIAILVGGVAVALRRRRPQSPDA